jgi:hypothetical protein
MPKCTICFNKHREKIDIALASGLSERSVAKQFNVSASAIHRHKADGHICKVIESAANEKKIQTGLNIQKCAQDIYDLCFRAAQKAESQDLRSLGSCIAPAVKVLEILNKGNEGSKEPPKESAFWKSYMNRAGEVFDKQT